MPENTSSQNKSCAIFDLDGTLLLGPSSEGRFFLYLVFNGVISLKHIAFYLFNFLLTWRLRQNKAFYRGLDAERLSILAKDFVDKHLAKSLSKEGLLRVMEEKKKGRRTILLSGCPNFLLKHILKYTGCDEAIGLNLEEKNGKFTGRYIPPYPFGRGKMLLVESMSCDRSKSSGYGNHISDKYFLSLLKEPYCVNPGPAFKSYCKKRNIPVLTWKEKTERAFSGTQDIL